MIQMMTFQNLLNILKTIFFLKYTMQRFRKQY